MSRFGPRQEVKCAEPFTDHFVIEGFDHVVLPRVKLTAKDWSEASQQQQLAPIQLTTDIDTL